MHIYCYNIISDLHVTIIYVHIFTVYIFGINPQWKMVKQKSTCNKTFLEEKVKSIDKLETFMECSTVLHEF